MVNVNTINKVYVQCFLSKYVYIYILKYSHNLIITVRLGTLCQLRNVSSFRTTLIVFVIEAKKKRHNLVVGTCYSFKKIN